MPMSFAKMPLESRCPLSARLGGREKTSFPAIAAPPKLERTNLRSRMLATPSKRIRHAQNTLNNCRPSRASQHPKQNPKRAIQNF